MALAVQGGLQWQRVCCSSRLNEEIGATLMVSFIQTPTQQLQGAPCAPLIAACFVGPCAMHTQCDHKRCVSEKSVSPNSHNGDQEYLPGQLQQLRKSVFPITTPRSLHGKSGFHFRGGDRQSPRKLGGGGWGFAKRAQLTPVIRYYEICR